MAQQQGAAMSTWEMKDYAQAKDGEWEDKAAARRQLEEDVQKFLAAGREIERIKAERRDKISDEVRDKLRKSLAYYEERNLTKTQKEARRKS